MGVFVRVMIGFSAVIVFCILTWLICYIVRFMMKKRSREFASYLMLGMEKRQIAAMFFGENLILGCFALMMGMILGTFFQMILNLTMGNCIFIFSGFVIACYLFYKGAAAMLLDYIESKGKAVYKGGNLFLLRQILSKARTMQATLGTITVFFSFAFVSFSIAIMFQDYINHQVEQKLPFDVIIYENDTNADFKEEENLIKTEREISMIGV